MDKILESIKAAFPNTVGDASFDAEFIGYINSAFSLLGQRGVGPADGFRITGEEDRWDAFISNDLKSLEMVKHYVYLKVRLNFDPPQNAFLHSAMVQEKDEYEWRIVEEVPRM